MDRVAELQDANFELSGSSKGNPISAHYPLTWSNSEIIIVCMTVQAAKIAELERQIKALKDDKNAISKERDLAVKEFEGKTLLFT